MSIPKVAHLAAGLCLVLAGSRACAQSAAAVDCEGVKNTTRPVELTYRALNDMKVILQSYRQPSHEHIVWIRLESPNAAIVTKFHYVEGILTEAHETATLGGKRKATDRKFNTEGYPKNFDRRSSIQYKMTTVATYADSSSDESSVTNSYTFKSEDKITIGSCVLSVVHGETESIDPKSGKRIGPIFQLYFPELKLTALSSVKEPVPDELKTSFAPIKPLQ